MGAAIGHMGHDQRDLVLNIAAIFRPPVLAPALSQAIGNYGINRQTGSD